MTAKTFPFWSQLLQSLRLRGPLSQAVVALSVLGMSLPFLGETAFADPGAETTSDISLSRPRVYRPAPQRVYRPAPRRVYVRPAYGPSYYPGPYAYSPMFTFGVGGGGTSFIGGNTSVLGNPSTGGGFDLNLGWRIVDEFSLDMNIMVGFHETQTRAGHVGTSNFSSLSLDGRIFLTDYTERLQPYIQVGVGSYFFTRWDWPYAIAGIGVQAGLGLDFYLTQGVSLGAKLLYRGAQLNDGDAYTIPSFSTWISALSYGVDVKFHF